MKKIKDMNYEEMTKYIEKLDQIDEIAKEIGDPYFKNLNEIERVWKKVKDKGFSKTRDKDTLLKLCSIGRDLFTRLVFIESKRYEALKDEKTPPERVVPKTAPCYERAIMLLEAEERWIEALDLVEKAMEIGIPNEWYKNQLNKIQEMIGKYR